MKVKWLCAASVARREASASGADPVLHHQGGREEVTRYAEGAMN